MLRSLLSLLLLGSAAAFSPAFGSLAARRHTPAARMMFGGGDKKDGDGNFMDKLKVRAPHHASPAAHSHAGLAHGPSAGATPWHAGGEGHVQPRDDEEVL